ncbi:MAG: DNA topoisomerase IV subunit A [Acidobacteria bacterium]|nr:DNA topoisomerase IV subunit A [Acidobacteriota bacterium]
MRSLIDENFLEYASYVIKDRAIPHIDDGLKPVQRRILHTLWDMDDGKFHKVANVVGRSMQYHPHGDASIYSALVVMANRDYFIDKQGNFGNIHTGDSASAARYIECRLTGLAKEVLFNKEITEFVASYDGRNQEPVTLPAKIPVVLLQGTDGIAVGLATHILPHNLGEVLSAQIAYLRGESFELYPDFQQGGLMDVSQYQDGNGKIKVRARLESRDDKHVVIKEIPFGTTSEKVIASIEAAIRKNRIKVAAIQDYTAERVEIELALPRGVYAEQVEEALYAFSDCEVNHSPALVVIKDDHPVQLSVTEVVVHCTDKLVRDLRLEYEIELGKLNDKLHYKTLEQIFIENRIYKNIEEKETYAAVIAAVHQGLEPFADRLIREVTDEDVERLLQIKIKRISRFDINKSRQEIQEVLDRIEEVNAFLSDMIGTTIGYLSNLRDKYGPLFPRRTEIIGEIEKVDLSEVAVQSERLSYDPETGYLGTDVKGEQTIACSPFDKILVFMPDHYRVMSVPTKMFIGKDLLFFDKADKTTVFNCMYREQTSGLAYVKRFVVDKFILDKEYEYTMENAKVLLLQPDPAPSVKVFYPKAKRSRVTDEVIEFKDQLIKGVTARGNRVSTKPVTRIRVLASKDDHA